MSSGSKGFFILMALGILFLLVGRDDISIPCLVGAIVVTSLREE